MTEQRIVQVRSAADRSKVQEMLKQGWKVIGQSGTGGDWNVGKTAVLGAVFLPLALAGKEKSATQYTLEREVPEGAAPDVTQPAPARRTGWHPLLWLFFWPVLLPYWIWKRPHTPKWAQVAVTAACVVVLWLAAAATRQNPSAPAADATPAPAAVPSPAATAAARALPSYEVLSESKANGTDRVEVYTQDTATDPLVAINDKLFAQYRPGIARLYIDYFNDKAAAAGYFQNQASDSVSEAEKNRLYSHYVANMMYNSNTGLSRFVRQGDSQTVLKSY